MTVEAPPEAPARRTWSVSAARSYDTREGGCPRQWSYRYGPHRVSESATDTEFDVPRRSGKVLHAAIEAGLRAARDEVEGRGVALPPHTTLRRYYGPARAALGRAWDAHHMPSDSVVAGQVTELFENALDDIEIPPRGAFYSVEHRAEVTGPQGTPLVFVADFAHWVAPGVLRVVDWKSGFVDPADVPTNWQLLVYAALIMRADPQVRAVEIELYALRQRRGFVHRVSAEQADRALRRLERVAAAADADLDPSPRPGPHCVSCRFRRICPESAAAPSGAGSVTLGAPTPTGRNEPVSTDASDPNEVGR